MKRAAWWVLTFFAMFVALYAVSYLVFREKVFPPQLKASFLARPWGIYTHALFGAIAMALGPFQFRRGILNKRRWLHRLMGRVYVIACILAGAAGLYMAFYAFGGAVTRLGFGGLAIVLLVTTIQAFLEIRRGNVAAHRQWIIRSYAMIFAAVTLRLELPLLSIAFGGFEPAYRIVAWSCWVPNLLFAETYLRASAPQLVPMSSRA